MRCPAVFTRCLAVFVDFSYFYLLFLLVVNFDSYFLLGLGVRFVTFLLVVTFNNYFLLGQEGQGVKGSIHCATGEVERVQKLIFFLIFFTVEGEGGGS